MDEGGASVRQGASVDIKVLVLLVHCLLVRPIAAGTARMSAALAAGTVLAAIGAVGFNCLYQFVLRQTCFVGCELFDHLSRNFVCRRGRVLAALWT